MVIYEHEEWMEDAECRRAKDPDIFHPYQGKIYHMTAQAKSFCQRCLVSNECLEYAIKNRIDYGIYGGFLPDQRRSIIRRRNRGKVS